MNLRSLYKRSPRLRRTVRRRKDAATYWLVQIAVWMTKSVSLPRALAISDRVGDLAYLTLRRTRRLSLEHIEIALGDELTTAARQQIVRASFRNIARCFCELARFETIRAQLDDYVEVEGWQYADELLAGGRGAIVVTGHLGNWELLGAYFALKGIPVCAIARRMKDPRLNRLLVDFRARHGVETVVRQSPSASRQIIKTLRRKGALALVIDQDTRTPSISVPFFGRMARTPVAAALLAVRRNRPVLPAFAQRRPDGGQRLVLLPPMYPPNSGNQQQDILAMTRSFSTMLEARVRDNPAEWVWWHRRWRHAPMPRLDLDSEIQYSGSVLPQNTSGGRI